MPREGFLCVAEIVAGIEGAAYGEFDRRLGTAVQLQYAVPSPTGPTEVQFTYTGDLAVLARLGTVSAVSLVHRVPVPRPRALLSNDHFRALIETINRVRRLAPAGTYRTLHLSAAGAGSSVLVRLTEELARATGLEIAPDAGDLHLRLRRPLEAAEGWDMLVRLAPRPLATRPWRVANLPGALNATVAHAMALLTTLRDDDVYANLCCGSGTLLIERCAAGPAARVFGCDTDPAALDAARANIAASRHAARIGLHNWDARTLPLADASVSALTADLPFGVQMGNHATNRTLYPALLAEAARVARTGAHFALLTSEVKLTETMLAAEPRWTTVETHRVGLNGLFPCLFVLRRAR